jgi:UDP-N-acetylmuramate: L-alanyl-gamma-D-glutamyl-meso-diaminopimelate ligase
MKKIHFIAIGGAAMHNMAIALHKNGNLITGSDDKIFDPAKTNLDNFGLLPSNEGWFPEKIHKDLDFVILGMHARADNPELIKAKEEGIKVYSFPEYVYEHSANKKRIVIGGSHGKTSITGMILHVLQSSGINADFLLGASVPGIDGNVKLSHEAQMIIIEGDEYLTSPDDLRPKFHLYKPHVAVISGIAWDHINVFKTFEDYKKQFEIFTQLIEPEGTLIYCAQDPHVCQVTQNTRSDIKKIPYSLPLHKIENGKTILINEGSEVSLEVFGNHNLLNLEAARLACVEAGLHLDDFYKHISTWKGAYNRLTKIHSSEHLTVFRDFAHAPSKVQATVEAVRKQFPDHQLIACLELHTFSSLSKEFLPHYQGSMDACDNALLFYSPHAVQLKRLELPQKEDIIDGFANSKLQVFTDPHQLKLFINQTISKQTVVLYMSSGNFDGMDLM